MGASKASTHQTSVRLPGRAADSARPRYSWQPHYQLWKRCSIGCSLVSDFPYIGNAFVWLIFGQGSVELSPAGIDR